MKIGLPGGSVVICLLMQEMQGTWVWSRGQEDPLDEEMATPQVFSPGKFHGQRSLEGHNPGCLKE